MLAPPYAPGRLGGRAPHDGPSSRGDLNETRGVGGDGNHKEMSADHSLAQPLQPSRVISEGGATGSDAPCSSGPSLRMLQVGSILTQTPPEQECPRVHRIENQGFRRGFCHRRWPEHCGYIIKYWKSRTGSQAESQAPIYESMTERVYRVSTKNRGRQRGACERKAEELWLSTPPVVFLHSLPLLRASVYDCTP